MQIFSFTLYNSHEKVYFFSIADKCGGGFPSKKVKMKNTIVFIEIGVWDNMATNHGAAVTLSKIKHFHSEETLVLHSLFWK